MSKDGVEEVMVALAASRHALEQRRKELLIAQQNLELAKKEAKVLISEARRAAAALIRPPERELSTLERKLKVAEHKVLQLEEMLFVALQVISNRISKD